MKQGHYGSSGGGSGSRQGVPNYNQPKNPPAGRGSMGTVAKVAAGAVDSGGPGQRFPAQNKTGRYKTS